MNALIWRFLNNRHILTKRYLYTNTVKQWFCKEFKNIRVYFIDAKSKDRLYWFPDRMYKKVSA